MHSQTSFKPVQKLLKMRCAGATLLILLLSACAGSDDEIKPAELVDFEPGITVKRLWSTNLGKGGEGLLLGLAPASSGSKVYAASSDGKVAAFDTVSGALHWRTELGKQRGVAAGPGVGAELVVVGTTDGEIIALAKDTGEVRWTSEVNSSVLAAPAVSTDGIAVRTVDGQLKLLDINNGTEQWNVDRRIQGLTLRGSSSPVFAANAVVSGFDNGKVAAFNVATGQVLWEQSITERRGRNELERLADVDGNLVIDGEDLYLVGFQGRAVLMSLRTGQPIWEQDMSSHNAVAVDWQHVYISTADDELLALDRRNGLPVWKSTDFAHRQLTGPVVVGSSVVVGDFEGYLHWLSVIDGQPQARTRAGSAAIRAPLLAVGDIVYVQNDKGELHAFSKPTVVP
ncbi:MAG: outer membrane protein assembly factor BamB [Gammaproteobacteria bacterium]|nr:outer membrane protein assembly factor BamB [Gammaproteobacteria bacterium]